MIDINRLKKSLIEHEGLRYEPYKDHLGNWTIGVGHYIPKDQEEIYLNREKPLTNAEVDNILHADIMVAVADAEKFIPMDSIDPQAFEIVVEMSFQLGLPRLSKFKNFQKALQEQNYIESSNQMLDSLWAKQVPNRANKLAKMMRDI